MCGPLRSFTCCRSDNRPGTVGSTFTAASLTVVKSVAREMCPYTPVA